MQSRSVSSHKFALRRQFLVLIVSLLTALMPELAAATPVDTFRGMRRPPVPFDPQMSDLPPISLKYFQDMLYKIDPDTCVFYYHLGTAARTWAKKREPSSNTVWWAFEPKAYEDYESPLKEYIAARKEIKYWELMCEVYTKACGGHSWVFIKLGDPDEPAQSVWTCVEYATIKKQESGIVEVVRVDQKGENGRTIWKKPETGTAFQAGRNGPPPSPIGGQPSMYQNGPPAS